MILVFSVAKKAGAAGDVAKGAAAAPTHRTDAGWAKFVGPSYVDHQSHATYLAQEGAEDSKNGCFLVCSSTKDASQPVVLGVGLLAQNLVRVVIK